MMIPRPVQMPLALWLLWRRSSLRLPFVGLFAAHAVGVLLTGYAVDWFETSIRYGAAAPVTYGPTAYVGVAWLIVGIPLGIWLTLRGHPGWAGLSVSPYILHGYLLWPLIELVPEPRRERPPVDATEVGQPVAIRP